MKNVRMLDSRRYYMSEFAIYDCDHFVTFNIIEVDTVKKEITVAISNEGKISQSSFDLKFDETNGYYFEYGLYLEKIAVDDFEQIKEEK